MSNDTLDLTSLWKTVIRVKNMHCASCVSTVQKTLAGAFGAALVEVRINVLSQEITISHIQPLSASALCRSLSNAAFEVYNAASFDASGIKIQEIGSEDISDDGWLEAALRLSSSGSRPINFRNSVHIANCDACRKGSITQEGADLSNEMLLDHHFHGLPSMLSASSKTYDGEESHAPSSSQDHSPHHAKDTGQDTQARPFEAMLSIGGMTCASCTGAIDHGLAELSYVKSVNVTLMTDSARVVYYGPDSENLQKIVDAVEDLGYDCTVERSGVIETVEEQEESARNEAQRRTVMLKVEGMFCKHCPPRIVDVINSAFPERVTIEKTPTLKEPVMKLTYSPLSPSFTIKNIIATIEAINKSFKATIYKPPSIEQRSHATQKREQRRLLIRLLLSFIVTIPTLLIGVVWMTLVPESNNVRQFFEQTVWSGNVTRTNWALFILATPVYFLAADVFHLRAIKEIRALWRKGSRVPILQRFCRFGSMNLLISAGTSVAYFASIAVLAIDATASSASSSHSSTYFDSVVFLTFFILIGRYLEVYSKAKTGDAVGMLGNLRPREAILVGSFAEEAASDATSTESTDLEKGSAPHHKTKRIDADLLEIGDIVIVSHGSSPPADGILVEGSTNFNESSLTGESRAVPKQVNDTVFVGAINVGDPVTIMVTSIGGTSMLDQIVAVVREGQTKRAPVERTVDTITGYFVPVITALAIITFIIWLSLGYSGALSEEYLDSQQGGWAFWSLEFAIAVFVVACPCGIGLAAPTALFVGGGLAARKGILVRGGGEAFQEASNVEAVVFDKTGTLTQGGDLTVTDHEMLAKDEEADIAWSIIKSLEETSTHPLARALLEFASERPSPQIETISITEKPGLGLHGTFTAQPSSSIDTQRTTYEAALGSETLISSLQPPPSLNYYTKTSLSTYKTASKSISLLAIRRTSPANSNSDPNSNLTPLNPWTLTATFAIADPIRPSALPTITTLNSLHIPVYMLTGDNPTTALAVASTLSIPASHVFAGVLPTEKASKIRWLQEHAPRRQDSSSVSRLRRHFPKNLFRKSVNDGKGKQKKATIAFVGDGINDAPALLASNISISLSTASDIAMHSSSFILLSPSSSPSNISLSNILTLFQLSSRVFRRVKFNFAWALVYNVVLVPVAAGCFFAVGSGDGSGGWRLGPVWGSAAMALSSLCVVGSSAALRWEGGWGVGSVIRWLKRGGGGGGE